jgi:hypothetical protein
MKQMGVGLAAAVLIDATIVRAVLLPARGLRRVRIPTEAVRPAPPGDACWLPVAHGAALRA